MAWFPANLESLRGGARFQDLCQEGVPERLASQSGFSSIAFTLSLDPLASRVCQQGALCWIKHIVLGRGAQKTTRTHLYYVFFSPLLYHIIFDKPFIYLLLLMCSSCTILCFRCTTEWFTSFTGYPSFIVIIKYWLCSLCCTIYFCSLFILYILVGTSFFIQFSCSVASDSLRPHGLQHARLPCPSPTPRACTESCPLSRWCHPTNSSSVVSFSFWLQFKKKLCLAALGLCCYIWLSLVAVVSGAYSSLLCAGFVEGSVVAEHGLQ